MKTSEYLIPTLKETPADAVVVSHQLMLRAGMIRQLAAGIYSWLPLGLRVLRNVEQVVREEMNQAGAQEILMPILQPAELWQESGRWDEYGPELMRLMDRHDRPCVLGPTHEEVVTHLIRGNISSYKQVPLNVYQIQTKCRDEVRPRFGVMRGRDFIMKDAYSFHLSTECLKCTYQKMYEAYFNIFTRLDLEFCAVEADSGAIGGSASHEFHVVADSGEDVIVYDEKGTYAANLEKAAAPALQEKRAVAVAPLEILDTPNVTSIIEIVQHFEIPVEQTVKTLMVKASKQCEAEYVALLLRGDHVLNEVKAEHHPWVATPFEMASEQAIIKITGGSAGSWGPVNLKLPCIADLTVANMSDFVAGANDTGKHYRGINWGRDCSYSDTADLRNAVAGDTTPDGHGHYSVRRGIEVGHIFQLGDKYSKIMKAEVLNDQGKNTTLIMGCYGIGITRIVAAAIEQFHDDRGIVWPDVMAPFNVIIIPLKIEKSQTVRTVSESLYANFVAAGMEVLMDDRKASPGVKFSDAELIGIPHQIIVSDRGLKDGTVEYRNRKTGNQQIVKVEDVSKQLFS